jgi:hypothetical protein
LLTHDPDAYDRQRDDDDFERGTGRETDDRIVFLDALCGVSEPWHDLDSEGFPACGR